METMPTGLAAAALHHRPLDVCFRETWVGGSHVQHPRMKSRWRSQWSYFEMLHADGRKLWPLNIVEGDPQAPADRVSFLLIISRTKIREFASARPNAP